MPRLYVSNASYPELREIGSAWDRHRAWWRAFRSALGDYRFWVFVGAQVLIVGLFVAGVGLLTSLGYRSAFRGVWIVRSLLAASTFVVVGFLVVTWGGDLIRPHLRRTSPTCRDACPGCGHQLTGHLETEAVDVRCPECGVDLPRSMFDPPFVIPRRFLAVGRWRGG